MSDSITQVRPCVGGPLRFDCMKGFAQQFRNQIVCTALVQSLKESLTTRNLPRANRHC